MGRPRQKTRLIVQTREIEAKHVIHSMTTPNAAMHSMEMGTRRARLRGTEHQERKRDLPENKRSNSWKPDASHSHRLDIQIIQFINQIIQIILRFFNAIFLTARNTDRHSNGIPAGCDQLFITLNGGQLFG